MLEIIQIIFGAVFVLFVPGFALSFAFFPKKEIDWIERIALSFGLSIAIVPLLVFYLNRFFGVKIDILSVSISIISLAIAGVVAYLYRLDKLPTIKKHVDNIKRKLHRTKNKSGWKR